MNDFGETLLAPSPAPEDLADKRSNVQLISNVFERLPTVARPEDDIAFRCRVRGPIALNELVPVGVIDPMTGQHNIPPIPAQDREAALAGSLIDRPFSLLPEQIKHLNGFTCPKCGRSQVSVWWSEGKEHRRFVDLCICRRPTVRGHSK
jgi:hypothetical protein